MSLAMLSLGETLPSRLKGKEGQSLLYKNHIRPLSGDATAVAAAGEWSIVASPNRGMRSNVLRAVACASASECWAVGQYNNGSVYQTLIERWDGTSWTIVSSPNTSPTQSNYLRGVTCSSPSDCWAAGYSTTDNVNQTLAEHWDGASWTIVPSPSTLPTDNNYLNGVTCVAASDCWAAGFAVTSTSSIAKGLIEHWDGNVWSIVPSPNTSGVMGPTQSNILNSVACASASDCWAGGYYYTNGLALQTVIEHWNGASWAIVNSPNLLPTESNHFQGVTCVTASDCWAVGDSSHATGPSASLIERWDGTSWTAVTAPNTNLTQSNALFGVTCVSTADCWAVGEYYTGSNAQSGVNQTLTERWDGTSWAIFTSPNSDAAQNNVLYGVTCVSAGDCWAVGYGANASGVNQSLIERFALPPVQLVSIVSRKVHGSAGTFEVDLPLTGTPAIECRSGGTNAEYTIAFTFANPLTSVGSATVTAGTGSVSNRRIGADAHQYIVDLSGVTDAQTVTISLTSVSDSAGNSSAIVSASMAVLIGDTTADGFVNSGDIAQTKSQSGVALTTANFREDVTVDGNLNSGDIALVKSKSGTALP